MLAISLEWLFLFSILLFIVGTSNTIEIEMTWLFRLTNSDRLYTK